MGKINGCLKCLFIFFNVLFAILGGLLCYGAMRCSAIIQQLQLSAVSSPYLTWIWLFAISFLGISCLGIFAGSSEKKIILQIFAGFMVVGMIIMLIFGTVTVVERNKIKSSFDSAFTKVAKSFKENKKFRPLLDGLQHIGQCCGVVSASDWGDNIPNSCECSEYGHGGYGGYGWYGWYEWYRWYGRSGCKSKPQGVSGPDRIHAQSCHESVFVWIDLVFKTAMGLCFGFAIIALLGLLFSLLMIHQIRHHNISGRTFIAMRVY